MQLTKKQTTEVLSKFLAEKNDLNEVLELVLDSQMYSVTGDYPKFCVNDKTTGFRN